MQKIIVSIQNNVDRHSGKAEHLKGKIEFAKERLCNISNSINKYERANKNGRFDKCIQELRAIRFRAELRLSSMETMYKSHKETESFWLSQKEYVLKEVKAI